MGFKFREFRESWHHSRKLKSRKQKFVVGVPLLALFRENKIRESQYYCHSRNLNPSKCMPYTVLSQERLTGSLTLCILRAMAAIDLRTPSFSATHSDSTNSCLRYKSTEESLPPSCVVERKVKGQTDYSQRKRVDATFSLIGGTDVFSMPASFSSTAICKADIPTHLYIHTEKNITTIILL